MALWDFIWRTNPDKKYFCILRSQALKDKPEAEWEQAMHALRAQCRDETDPYYPALGDFAAKADADTLRGILVHFSHSVEHKNFKKTESPPVSSAVPDSKAEVTAAAAPPSASSSPDSSPGETALAPASSPAVASTEVRTLCACALCSCSDHHCAPINIYRHHLCLVGLPKGAPVCRRFFGVLVLSGQWLLQPRHSAV